jgi:hypothetical protein
MLQVDFARLPVRQDSGSHLRAKVIMPVTVQRIFAAIETFGEHRQRHVMNQTNLDLMAPLVLANGALRMGHFLKSALTLKRGQVTNESNRVGGTSPLAEAKNAPPAPRAQCVSPVCRGRNVVPHSAGEAVIAGARRVLMAYLGGGGVRARRRQRLPPPSRR